MSSITSLVQQFSFSISSSISLSEWLYISSSTINSTAVLFAPRSVDCTGMKPRDFRVSCVFVLKRVQVVLGSYKYSETLYRYDVVAYI